MTRLADRWDWRRAGPVFEFVPTPVEEPDEAAIALADAAVFDEWAHGPRKFSDTM